MMVVTMAITIIKSAEETGCEAKKTPEGMKNGKMTDAMHTLIVQLNRKCETRKDSNVDFKGRPE
jgi:hypothetical protein